MIENTDYELIPGENDFWNIRILTGDYVETEYRYNKISIKEDDRVHYEVEVLKTPRDDDWEVDADLDWHNTTSDILLDIFDKSVSNIENK